MVAVHRVQILHGRLTRGRISPMLQAAPRARANPHQGPRRRGYVEKTVNMLHECHGWACSSGLEPIPKPAFRCSARAKARGSGRFWDRLLVGALVLGGCRAPGPGVVDFTCQEWSQNGLTGRRLTTDHFEIVSTLRDAEFENALPGFVEAAYRRYEATLPVTGGEGPRLTMYVFGTRFEWERYTQRHFPTRYEIYRRIRNGGFTEGDLSVSFFTNRAATLATLAHEGWHQYVGSRLAAPIPAWLNEGLACYHEAVEFVGPKPRFTPRHNTFRINALREAVRRDELLSIRELVDTDAGQVISYDRGWIARVYYAQAWALITFLRHGDGGRYAGRFEQMLRDVAEGTFSVQISAAALTTPGRSDITLGQAAFRQYFGRSPEDLQEDYYDYLVRVCGF